MTAIVDGLVARGLVERRHVDADRRQVDHVLTDSGRQALDLADAAVDARLGEIAACLGRSADSRAGLRRPGGCGGRAFGAYRLARRAGR